MDTPEASGLASLVMVGWGLSNPGPDPNQAYNFYKGCSILYAYPFIFLPIVRGHLVATADAGAPLELGLGSGLG